MKRRSRFVLSLVLFSVLAGYLLSKASWVGRTGINFFYKQYRFLKVWWQAGLVVLVVWLLFYVLQAQAQRRLLPQKARLVHIGAIVLALLGLFFTYQDFRNNTAHRWLRERFHLGGYLFWLGWIAISIFFLTEKRAVGEQPTEGKV